MIKIYIKKSRMVWFAFLVVGLIFSTTNFELKSKPKKVKIKTKVISKKKGKSKRVNTSGIFNIIHDTAIAEGIDYKIINIGTGRLVHSVHVIEADISDQRNQVSILKAGNKVTELEKLHDIIAHHDSDGSKIIGAINGNFWRAVSNFPIGPTFSDGEAVELITHKKWSSCFFDKNGKPYIDNYYVKGIIVEPDGNTMLLRAVNHRKDETGLVLYNRFAGDTIPYCLNHDLKKALKESLIDLYLEQALDDSTEVKLDTAEIKNEILINRRIEMDEYNLPKIVLKYLSPPTINREVQCIVTDVKYAGAVGMPSYGCILSYGTDFDYTKLPKVGEKINIKFSTNVNESIEFTSSVAGTPRLVRNGLAKHEAVVEGSHGRRFINRPLSRTAIGTNKSRGKFFLVAIESSNNGKAGASLAQLSIIMKKLGAYNAMNLDGGGSTTMVIDGKNVLYKNHPDASRRLSVAVAIQRKKEVLKNIFRKS